MEDIDVFYMDPAFIDPDVYDLWLRGFCGNLEHSHLSLYLVISF